jgi:phosphoribosylglycinamide formyltransferase-1
MTVKLAVLISGGGTTLQNFIDRIAAGQLDAVIEVVVSSRPGVAGLDRARRAHVPHCVVPRKAYPSTEAFSAEVWGIVDRYPVDLVTMAGFLSLIQVPTRYVGRVMNIHPALIPAFCGERLYGHRVHEAVLAYGAKVSGCTVHFADNVYDHGPIIIQRCVPVLDDDTPENLAARVFKEECIAYPEAIRLFGQGRLSVEGRRVRVAPEPGT